MQKTPKNFEEFLHILKERHALIMHGRPEKQPGKFNQVTNRAGSTTFVAPELVKGTLKKGFEVYQVIDIPLHKAIFMMFLVAEVHPFIDGNGRIARIMMNAELVAALEQRIQTYSCSFEREGWEINHKRVYRLYCEESLQMRRKKPKRRVQAKTREDVIEIKAKNDCWCMEFVADQLFTGERLRALTILDIFTRQSPQIGVGLCYKSIDVVKSLEKAIKLHGKPKAIRVDHGPEFIAKELDLWAYSHGIILDFTRPGKILN